LKKIRSLNLKTKIFSVGLIASLGFSGTFFLNKFLKEAYNSRKSNLEERISKFLNKKVDLGVYSGVRFLGFSLANPNILDKENLNSEIKANNIYVGIMPFKSFLNQKWIIKIRPYKAEINVDKDFFKTRNSYESKKKIYKSKINYDLNFNLAKYSTLKLDDLGVKTKVKGNFIYKSKDKQIIGNIKSKFEGKGNLRFKLNTKLNQEFLKFELFSNGLDLNESEYIIDKRKYIVKKGKFKSNFKFYKSSTRTFCKGKFFVKSLIVNTSFLAENINSNSFNFFCKDNNLKANSENLNYGTLSSKFSLNIPLNEKINNIDFNGSIGYINSLNPDIKFLGTIPYWMDKKVIKFGNIDSSFNVNRTQLSNLNVFRKNRIRGFVTANGKLQGKLINPEILINFNIDYPHYKGIRIREIWEGEIKNENNKFLLNMKNRYSPIPSFLSIGFNNNLKIDNVIFSRIFNSNKGILKINKNNENYIWNANNFPLDELELAISNNKFDRVSGIINGAGYISPDQSSLEGRLAWSLGKYRNIKFANSLFDFSLKDKSFLVNASLYPIDGGMIEVEYDANKINLFNVNFKNISTSWSILTAIDIFNFDNKKEIPKGNSKNLNDLQISKDEMSFKERIQFINNFLEQNIVMEDKYKVKRFLRKFDSRFDAKLTIEGDTPLNYKVKTRLEGYLDVSNNKNIKEQFSLDLNGGLIKGKGSLEIRKLPFKILNIFLDKPKDFSGNLDINLFYNLDSRSFSSDISSNNTTIKNKQLIFNKGRIEYENSIFDVNFSLLLDDSLVPMKLDGSIPLNKEDNLDLRLIGNGKFIRLIDILVDDYFNFNEGKANIRMLIKGSFNKPIINGFIVMKDSEIDIYNNIIKDIDSLIIFDFDNLEIKNLKASGENTGNIFMRGSLPFYGKDNQINKKVNLKTNKFNVKTNNLDFLIDSNIDISGSFEKPTLGGNLALNNGFINFNNDKKDIKNNNRNLKDKNLKNNWPELYWDNDKNIEIISNETILNSVLLGETLPNYLENLSFDNLKLKLGPDFKLQYSEIVKAYLDTKLDLNINGNIGNDLNARGLIYLERGRANLYTTPFKLDKNKDNYILFASRSGVVPYINFSLVSKVPDSIIPISENNQDTNISKDLNENLNSQSFGAFGIGNTRLIKIEASYEGFLDQLSFEDENKRIQLRSSPSYNRSQIIGLIGGNSANLINRAFISQINSADVFSERFQLSLYPALIENNDSLNNVFSNEKLDIENDEELTSNESFSSQAWVAEIGLDMTDKINFAVQATPGRDDLPPLGILTFQANPNLELLGSFDSNGDWKSEVQLFFRY
tara:strand:+ start:894 stop:4838 length:3945 start_codon:yes stop_codon:yes gene_type:complete